MSSIKQVKENINKKIKSGRSSRSTSSKGSNSSKSKSLFVQDFLEETDIKKIQRFLRSKLFIDKNTLDNRVKYLNYIQNNLKSIKENDCLEPGKLTDTFTVKNILNLEKLFSSKGTNSIIYKTSISKVFGNFPIATKVMKITEDNMNEIK
jgi:tRNA U34 5-carboxymethylaminomethyl modifying enzyme MnmG/GidA